MDYSREHWVCPTCGCGLCVPVGGELEQPYHIVLGDDGKPKFCGEYELKGYCPDDLGDD